MKRTLTSLLLAACVISAIAWPSLAAAQAPAYPPPKPEAVAHWQDLRFGMFIHWGPVSLTAKEIGWSRGKQTPIEEYDNLYKRFNPTKFDADEWVRIAKAGGMKYIVLTTKHHDGFCLWDTKLTDYNIMNSPFKRDVVKELAAACKKGGIEFGTYYSVCDWHHPDFPLTSPGGRVRREKFNLDAYNEYLLGQMKELVVNYGPILTMWNDVPQGFHGRGVKSIKMLRELQPDIVINNRTGDGGDYDTPEQQIGGFNMDRPWESCMTIASSNIWAWGGEKDGVKPLEQCLHMVIRGAGGNGNVLLNVGPRPDGVIDPLQANRLKEVGDWLGKYGESIYGTRGGPWKPAKDVYSTRKGNTVYIHALKLSGETLELPALPGKVVSAALLTGGDLKWSQDDSRILLTIPKANQQKIDTIVKLTLDGPADAIRPLSMASSGLIKPEMKAAASNVFSGDSTYAAAKAIDGEAGSRWATNGGTRQAWLDVDFGRTLTFDGAAIDEAFPGRVQSFELQAKVDGAWKTVYKGTKLGANFSVRFDPVTAQAVRLNILDATEGPTINELQLLPPKDAAKPGSSK